MVSTDREWLHRVDSRRSAPLSRLLNFCSGVMSQQVAPTGRTLRLNPFIDNNIVRCFGLPVVDGVESS
jgi:hypothetical protein